MHVSHNKTAGESTSFKEVELLYRAYYKEFMAWAGRKFNLSEEDRMDVYQDAIIIFYENSMDGKTADLKSSKKTYLFGIAKNLIYGRYREQQKMIVVEDISIEQRLTANELPEHREEVLQQVEELIKIMEEPCKSILTMFYYYNAELEMIKEQLGYTDKTVVKTQKSRCLKYLKDKLLPR
ncbi:MAG TPA: sigma-70 family RNA polymerase sigma factor [Cyclobacteriaceae bacterium]|nr:sigma-70 family RNA polymerase sigma factor [Cyclobacteriaceae bacterium]